MHTLFIANDNDFLGTITDTNHPAGIANPNQFFVFASDASELPAYVAQNFEGVGKERGHGHDEHACAPDRDDDH